MLYSIRPRASSDRVLLPSYFLLSPDRERQSARPQSVSQSGGNALSTFTLVHPFTRLFPFSAPRRVGAFSVPPRLVHVSLFNHLATVLLRSHPRSCCAELISIYHLVHMFAPINPTSSSSWFVHSLGNLFTELDCRMLMPPHRVVFVSAPIVATCDAALSERPLVDH